MPAIQWVSHDPVTGQVLEELPGIKLTSSLPAQIGRATGSVQLQLPINDRLPARWNLATRPWRAVLAAVFDDDQQTVLWAGPVERRTYGNGPTIDLTLTDVPGWMDRQYVPTLTLLGTEQTQVMRQVGLNQAAAQFHGQVDQTPTATTIDRRYKTGDDRTMLVAVTEVAKANGPEWCINWRIDNGALVCVPTVAARVGRAATAAGVYPVVLDRLPWSITEDYSPGKGAPTVTGTASAGGDQRIQVTRSATVERIAAEHRFQPEVTKPTTAQVAAHTTAKLAAIRNGTNTLTLDIPITDDRWVVGKDLQLGDDIEADLANPDLPVLNRTVRGRLFGWSAEADPKSGQIVKVTPILSADDGN